jgi:hypothetical protein
MSSAFIVAKQNQYLRRFQEAGAISPETAKGLEQVGYRDTRIFQRMVRREMIRQVSQGKYYLDVEAAQEFPQARRERALTALLIILTIAAVQFCFSVRM